MATNAPKTFDVERGDEPKLSTIWDHFMAEVDPALCTGPLTAYCFMTGFMFVKKNCILALPRNLTQNSSDVVSFSSIFVWCGFQSGNTAQASPSQ